MRPSASKPGAIPARRQLPRDRAIGWRSHAISLDDDIYRFEAGGRFQLVTGSNVSDTDPELSPDGRRLAFASARAGGCRCTTSGLPRLTDRTRSNSPEVQERTRGRLL